MCNQKDSYFKYFNSRFPDFILNNKKIKINYATNNATTNNLLFERILDIFFDFLGY
jgi:hypothetical protein